MSQNFGLQPLDDNPQVAIGQVISVKGSRAEIALGACKPNSERRPTVGKFIAIKAGQHLVAGAVTEVTARCDADSGFGDCTATACVDLVGEFRQEANGTRSFHRGVSDYPAIGDAATLVSRELLSLIYEAPAANKINIGRLYHDENVDAAIYVDSLINRHFAVLGSTGVGKSCGVAVILREILAVRKDLRIFLLDGHNEYGRCFGDHANVVSPRTLKLPFWMFNFEEFLDVLYAGRAGVEEEIEILAELIPIAKSSYTKYKAAGDRLLAKRSDPRSSSFMLDTPVPYVLQDLLSLIDERMGKLENRASRMNYHRLMNRIETIRNDPRYDFMFENANVGGDTMAELITDLFRIEANGRPMTVMQLAGLPVEVVDAVVCVLCRLAFEFGQWSDGAVPLLLVCEEAHRYIAVDRTVGFAPTRRALSRIAKEGRKYGVYLGLVSQRPAELDPTIVAQCNTLFAMRMSNERDQAMLRAAASDAATNLLDFVPSLAMREVIGLGDGVPVPARITFKSLPEHLLPRSEADRDPWRSASPQGSKDFVQAIIARWRHASSSRKGREEEPVGVPAPAVETIPSASDRLEQIRAQLMKR